MPRTMPTGSPARPAKRYRLLSEAEYEYALRGGTTTDVLVGRGQGRDVPLRERARTPT